MSEEKKTSTAVSIKGEVINTKKRGEYCAVTVKDSSGEYDTILTIDFKVGDKMKQIPEDGTRVYMSGYAKSREWEGKYFLSIYGSYFQKSTAANSVKEKKSDDFAHKNQDLDDEAPF